VTGVTDNCVVNVVRLGDEHLAMTESPLPIRFDHETLETLGRPEWADEVPGMLATARATGELVRSFDAPPAFCFHHVNAFEDGDEVVVDACVYDDPSVIDRFFLKRILAGDREGSSPPRLWRYRLDLTTGSASDEQLTELPFELPTIDYGRHNARPYRYAYGVSGNDPAWVNTLAKIDVSDGSFDVWQEPGCYPSEPVFVRDPDGDAEDSGVALSVVLDTSSGRSFMLVLDAQTWQEIARAEAPQHVPFGFHGQFFR
jgi:beta,beta-carotene 9',10'-dioxygenase